MWPSSWNRSLEDPHYPGISDVGLTYDIENKPYAFSPERNKVYMKEGTSVLFRDVLGHDEDMPDTHVVGLCGLKSEQEGYADNPLYLDYVNSEGGKYEWRLSGINFRWVYPIYDSSYVSYGEQPSGNLTVSPEMVYARQWPEMQHPNMEESGKTHVFSVLDPEDHPDDRTFVQLPSAARSDVDDMYGDGKVQIIRSSIAPEDVCHEFVVQLNAIEYTPTYVAGGVEARCLGVGANFNHLPMLIRSLRVVSMHPHMQGEQADGVCDPVKVNQNSRECLDLNIGIEGRVVQREDVFVYLYYRIYEQRYTADEDKWEELDPNQDTLVLTNDPNPLYASAFAADEVTLEYEAPYAGVSDCDYRNPGHALEDVKPDDRYLGSFKVDLPAAYRVTDESDSRRRFGVYLDVDMVHQIEIGGTAPGLDYRIHSGSYDTPGCAASSAQVDRGLWNYSEWKGCPAGDENCELWMGPPSRWKEFDLFRPTVTPVPPTPGP